MYPSSHVLFVLCMCSIVLGVFSAPVAESAQDIMQQIVVEYHRNISNSLPRGDCTNEIIAVRKEWDHLSEAERADYLRAVQCLHERPSQGNGTIARNRFEDFALSHVKQALYIHHSGLLLPWHRYFLHLYENALRNECGYQGYQPYWDWSRYVNNPSNSTVFSGAELSFSGNGKTVPHGVRNITIPGGAPPARFYLRAPGTGGGCITGGAFENITLLITAENDGAATPVRIFEQPRCIKRDFLFSMLQGQNSYQNVTDLILNSPTIHTFRPRVEAPTGVHPGGHMFIGGENLNLFSSTNDPVFYMHHAMLDRVWAIWQSRDPDSRNLALDGHLTYENYPRSPNATLSSILRMGAAGEPRTIREYVSTTQGGLCYKYE